MKNNINKGCLVFPELEIFNLPSDITDFSDEQIKTLFNDILINDPNIKSAMDKKITPIINTYNEIMQKLNQLDIDPKFATAIKILEFPKRLDETT